MCDSALNQEIRNPTKIRQHSQQASPPAQTIFVKVEGTRKTLAIDMDPQRSLTALYAELRSRLNRAENKVVPSALLEAVIAGDLQLLWQGHSLSEELYAHV